MESSGRISTATERWIVPSPTIIRTGRTICSALLPERARRSLQVMVLDHRGRYTKAGSEVRILASGTRSVGRGRIVVNVEITAVTTTGRKVAALRM
jgi:hypothetical protein